MNNTVENVFGFPKVQWLHLTGEVDKCVTFHVKFSWDFLGHNVYYYTAVKILAVVFTAE